MLNSIDHTLRDDKIVILQVLDRKGKDQLFSVWKPHDELTHRNTIEFWVQTFDAMLMASGS